AVLLAQVIADERSGTLRRDTCDELLVVLRAVQLPRSVEQDRQVRHAAALRHREPVDRHVRGARQLLPQPALKLVADLVRVFVGECHPLPLYTLYSREILYGV